MTPLLEQLTRAIAASPAQRFAFHLLSDVPGFPPLIQTVHLLSIAAVMGSVVLIDLRALGLALSRQSLGDLTRRLMPWTWYALPFLAISGLVFVCARPARYLSNPIFGIKFAMLLPAVILSAVFYRLVARDPGEWERSRGRRAAGRGVALVSLILWIGIVLAGRWVAYADYIFPPE